MHIYLEVTKWVNMFISSLEKVGRYELTRNIQDLLAC